MTDQSVTDAAEVAKFEALSAEWWDPKGPMAPLHAMQPCRMAYVVGQICAQTGRDPASLASLDGLSVLDAGCGGGLASEPLARLGARVTGIDPAEGSVPVARAHAVEAGLEIDYRVATVQDLAAEGARFDAVIALEVIEHVPDPAGFVSAAGRLLAPGGPMILSTINRTAMSYALAIVAAERLLGWLPRGTHDWRRFPKPEELERWLRAAGLDPVDAKGMVRDPFSGDWRLSATDLSVNYIVTAVR